MTPARFASSAAFTLKNAAWRPADRTRSATSCARGSVWARSRWTPKTSIPHRASSTAVAAPKPLDAPRMRAQPSSCGVAAMEQLHCAPCGGRWILPSQPPGSIVGEGLGDLRFRVHNEGPVGENRLADGHACPQYRLKRTNGAGLELAYLAL